MSHQTSRPPTRRAGMVAGCAALLAVAMLPAAPSIAQPEAAASTPPPPATVQTATVRRIVDGDTIDVRLGGANRRVRLVQIDTPEVYSGPECYGAEASAALRRLLPVGSTVRLYTDPALDRTDGYGRLLRYVFSGTVNVNARMVLDGDAAPYFYDGDRGRYAAALDRYARAARSAKRGLWGACPRTVYDPYRSVDTGAP
jgi:endonuclease YncB( thermonuclease family)